MRSQQRAYITLAPGTRLPDDTEDSVDQWLAGRWRAFSRKRGRLLATPVRHQPWDLHAAELLACEENLLEHVGLKADEPPIVRFASCVSVSLGAPSPVLAALGVRSILRWARSASA